MGLAISSAQPMTLRALLFDLDGTLADTEAHGHRPAYNQAFQSLGLKFRWGSSLYGHLLKQPTGKARLLHYLTRYEPELGEHAEAVGEHPEAWVEHVHALKAQNFRARLEAGQIPLRPGVARLIRETARAGVRLALVTNASTSTVQPFLKFGLKKELAECLDFVITTDGFLRQKPAPDLYQQALRKLKLAPYECIAIEDSNVGLAAARAAGIPAVVTVNELTAGEDFSAASLVLDCLGEPNAAAHVLAGHMDEAFLSLKTLQRIAGQAAPRL